MAKSVNNKFLIESTLKALQIEFIQEFQFAKPRKFRADYYLPKFNTIIEYEGIVSKKSRHTNMVGYTNDCTKYNLASMLGYRVFRFTALNISEINTILTQLTNE